MYKTYITKWGLDKKNKEPEMRAIVRKYKQRENQGKKSRICVRKQQRNFADVVRYWERKGKSIDDIIARQTASPTPEAVEVSTPLTSPISTPPELATPERMLRCIRDYFRGSFESGTWVRTEPTSQCYSIKDKGGWSHLWPPFFNRCGSACSLFQRGSFHEAGDSLISTTANMKKLLSAEHPENLAQLVCLIIHIRHGRRRDELASSILRQFSAMNKVVLGSLHPLTRFCEWSLSVNASGFRNAVTKCMELIADEFASFVGHIHRSTLLFRMYLIEIMVINRGAQNQMLQKLLGECENTLQPDDFRVCHVRGYMANVCFEAGRYDDAMTLSQKNMIYAQDSSSMSAESYDHSYDLYVLAKCQHALGDVALGIATLRQAIHLKMSL